MKRFKIKPEWKNSTDVHERLAYAINEQGLSPERWNDVMAIGMDGGFPGFSYYSDTREFYLANEEDIWELLNELAEGLGETPMQVVAGFRLSPTTPTEFTNIMSWFAVEEIARYYEDSLKLVN